MTDQVNDSIATQTEEVTQVAQSEAAPEETSESAAPPVEDTASSTDETKPESKPEKTFTQAELDEILKSRLAKEHRKLERQARLEVENEYLRKQQAQTQHPAAKPVQEAGSGEPKPENFQTYEDYIEAVTDWKVDQKLDAKLQGLQEQSQQRKQQSAQAQHEARIAGNLNKAAEKYDDFHEVVSNPDLRVTVAMRDAIGDSDIGGEIAYYLGTNPNEAASIAQMTPVQQIKAIDRLEAKLKAPPPIPPVSKAPKPAELVGKGRVPGSVNLETANASEYEKARLKDKPLWAYR